VDPRLCRTALDLVQQRLPRRRHGQLRHLRRLDAVAERPGGAAVYFFAGSDAVYASASLTQESIWASSATTESGSAA